VVETVENNEKKKKNAKKTGYLQNIQFRHHAHWRLRIKLSFLCASCSIGLLKLTDIYGPPCIYYVHVCVCVYLLAVKMRCIVRRRRRSHGNSPRKSWQRWHGI